MSVTGAVDKLAARVVRSAAASQKGDAVMIHTIRYFGNFEKGFRTLTAETDGYFDRHGEGPKPLNEISGKVNGLHFRYMEMPEKEFVAVGVERIVLRAPVLLVLERHTDGKGFGSDPLLGDESAMHLLVDMIIANPESRDALGRLLRRLGGPVPSP